MHMLVSNVCNCEMELTVPKIEWLLFLCVEGEIISLSFCFLDANCFTYYR